MGQLSSKRADLANSRNNDPRRVLKNCFGNNLFALVPFEVWKEIAFECDGKSIVMLAQTCLGFKELVGSVRLLYFENAKTFRREDQIPKALKSLQRSAECGHLEAIFQMGYGYLYGGFGLQQNHSESTKWFKKAAENGFYPAMVWLYHLYC